MKGKMLIVSLVALMLTVMPIVVSCGPTPATPAATGAKPEGTLVIREPSLSTEDFLPWSGESATMLWEEVYDWLIYARIDGTYAGGLAERWETSKDALTVTAWLRKGIPWQDGWGEVTAEDVKYTYERIMEPGSTNARAGELRDSIESIEVVDPYTVVWHLKAPDPTWWLCLCNLGGLQMPIVCKKYIETVSDAVAMNKPIGSGPYRLVEHQFGSYLKFEALDTHWRIVPEFKYLVMQVIPEESTAIAMLKTGAIDVTPISPDRAPELEAAGLKTDISPGGYSTFMVFGGMIDPHDSRYEAGYHQMDPWKDVRVREAMNIAIDREAIVKAFYPGIGVPMGISYAITGWKDVKPIPYDPARAKQLLAEAGFPDGFSFRVISYTQTPGAELPKVCEAVCGYWEEIGLKPLIFTTDYPTYKPNAQKGKTAGDVWITTIGWRIDWTLKIAVDYMYEGTKTVFQSPELEGLCGKIEGELNWDKRNEAWGEVCKYMRDNYTTVAIANSDIMWGLGKKVAEMSPNLSGKPANYIYIRHAQPLNTFRLFELK